jgi:hypothetical protein
MNLRTVLAGFLITACVLAPIVPHLLSKEARLRFAEVNIFSDASVVTESNDRLLRDHNSLVSKLINNRRVGYFRSYLAHFSDNLQPDFLFGKGDGNPKFSIQDVGQMYPFEAPFLIIGIFSLLSSYPAVAVLLLYWIIAAIIPAATARETPHALRILNSLPVWQIFTAFGILSPLGFLKKYGKLLYAGIAVIALFYVFHVSYYLHSYYRHFPAEYSGEWQYGYAQALAAAAPIENSYQSVVITESIGRPYMYTLFYRQTPPADYIPSKQSYFDAAGFYHVDGFLKYRFGGKLTDAKPHTLYIWDAGNIPPNARVISTVRLLNGTPVLVLFDNGGI